MDNNTPSTTPSTTPSPIQAQIPDLQSVALIAALLAPLNAHIQRIVETKFNEMVANLKVMQLMDDSLKETITEMIDDKISEHTDNAPHKGDGDIEEDVTHQFDYLVRHGDHGFVTERELSEKVTDTLDEVLEEKVQALLNNASVEITL